MIFWRIWSATTPPVVALTWMFGCVLLKSSASWPEDLAGDVVLAVPHRDLHRPAGLLVVVAPAPAAARDHDGGRQRGQEADADHFGTSVKDDGAGQVARAVGVEPGGLGEGHPRPLGEHERGERVEVGRDRERAGRAGVLEQPSSAGPNDHTTAPGPAMLIGPWRYSNAG